MRERFGFQLEQRSIIIVMLQTIQNRLEECN